MGVVTFVGGIEGGGDWGERAGGEGWWGVKVFYCRLGWMLVVTSSKTTFWVRTPRYLLAQGEDVVLGSVVADMTDCSFLNVKYQLGQVYLQLVLKSALTSRDGWPRN